MNLPVTLTLARSSNSLNVLPIKKEQIICLQGEFGESAGLGSTSQECSFGLPSTSLTLAIPLCVGGNQFNSLYHIFSENILS